LGKRGALLLVAYCFQGCQVAGRELLIYFYFEFGQSFDDLPE